MYFFFENFAEIRSITLPSFFFFLKIAQKYILRESFVICKLCLILTVISVLSFREFFFQTYLNCPLLILDTFGSLILACWVYDRGLFRLLTRALYLYTILRNTRDDLLCSHFFVWNDAYMAVHRFTCDLKVI